MAGISSGSIPSYYREVFDIVAPPGGNKVTRSLWIRVFSTSHVSEKTLEEIWKLSDPAKTGCVGRDGLYKSLALTALAQQGKTVDESVFKTFGEKDLPIPTLGTMAELKDVCARFTRATNPNELGYTYEQLKSLDDVHVSLIPEKKGTLIKHNEYLVESRNFGSSASRRYKDFEGFHQVLLARFPYRLIPSLPPKSMTSSSEFIEQRKRALKRYLTLICRHPILIKDDSVRYFFTASGTDVGSRLKEKYKNTNDEFIFNPHSQNAKDLVTEQTRMKYERVCDQIACMTKIMSSILRIADNMEYRSRQFCDDMRAFHKGLDSISTEPMLNTPWTAGSDDSWPRIQSDCRRLADEFTSLGDRAKRQSEKQVKGFVESVYLFLDLLTAYQELANRREKLVHRKHQKALGKAQTMSKYKDHLESQGKAVSERQEHKFQKTDDDLIMIEARNFFSLLCLDLEAQLIHVNLSQLPEMLQQLVHVQIEGHQEFLQVWEGMKPLVDSMSQSTHSTPTSSLGGRSYTGTKSPPPSTIDTSPFH